jgi:serine/threonine protein kinase
MSAPEQTAVAAPIGVAAIKASWGTDAMPDAAAALALHPELLADKSAVLDLAYEEYCQRAEAGQSPEPESFCARFPAYRSSLRRLLAAHQFLAANSAVLRAAPEPRWPEPGQRWGDLTLLRELGRGTFARVYLATEASTGDRPVAVKLSLEGGAEARTLGRLSHPNVVPILSARSDPATGLTTVCMPFLGGATLTDVLDRVFSATDAAPPRRAAVILEAARAAVREGDPAPDAPPPNRRLLQGSYEEGVALVGLGLAEALAFLHARRVWHLDLKPSNVLLGTDGRPMLLDFNLSADGRNAYSRLGGTFPYMAPEQVEALAAGDASPEKLDGRADLFSLGVILYELLTGRLPFGPLPALPRDELAPLLLAKQREGCPPIRAVVPRAPRGLAVLAERCLTFDRDARPASAEEVAAVLRRYLAGIGRKRTVRRLAWLLPLVAAAVIGVRFAALALRPDPAELGRAAFRAQKYADAEQFFDQALRANPRDKSTLWKRALARLKLSESSTSDEARERLQLALAEFTAADRKHPSPGTQACIGYCFSRSGMHPEAIYYFNAAQAGGFAPASLYNNRAYSNLSRGNLDTVARDLDKATELNQNLAAAHYNRAVLAFKLWLRDPDQKTASEGRAAVTRALDLGLESPDVYCDAAHLALANHDQKEGLRLLGLAVDWGKDPTRFANDPVIRPILRELQAAPKRPPTLRPCPAVPGLAFPVDPQAE